MIMHTLRKCPLVSEQHSPPASTHTLCWMLRATILYAVERISYCKCLRLLIVVCLTAIVQFFLCLWHIVYTVLCPITMPRCPAHLQNSFIHVRPSPKLFCPSMPFNLVVVPLSMYHIQASYSPLSHSSLYPPHGVGVSSHSQEAKKSEESVRITEESIKQLLAKTETSLAIIKDMGGM